MRIQEFSPSTPLLLHWARQLFLGIPPFISDPGNYLSTIYEGVIFLLPMVILLALVITSLLSFFRLLVKFRQNMK